jgi:hypothetical protein
MTIKIPCPCWKTIELPESWAGKAGIMREQLAYYVPILFGPCFAVSRIRRCAEKVKGFCERGERSDDVQREGREIVSPYPDEGEGRGLVRLRTFLKRSFP